MPATEVAWTSTTTAVGNPLWRRHSQTRSMAEAAPPHPQGDDGIVGGIDRRGRLRPADSLTPTCPGYPTRAPPSQVLQHGCTKPVDARCITF